MNNPPDVSQDPSEHEEYAHNVQKQTMPMNNRSIDRISGYVSIA